MKRFMLALAASAAAIAVATPASAAIFIGVSVNGGPITQVATDGGSGSVNYNTTTGGYFYNIGATGSPILNQPQLLTQSINVQSTGGVPAVIDVYITQTDLNALNGGLLSTFTSNTIQGVAAQLTSYYSASNAMWGGTQLQTAGFTSTGVMSGGNNVNVGNNWSETVRYTLNFTGGNGSNFNGTVNLTAVPEPATWGMMLLGFGALGAMLRTRRRSTTARIRFA